LLNFFKDILKQSCTVGREKAIEKTNKEYEIYKEKMKNSISQEEKDFIKRIQ